VSFVLFSLSLSLFFYVLISFFKRERISQDIAGPCCFAGDLIASERQLPPIKQV
jgi:diaminopimelate decarboxylase